MKTVHLGYEIGSGAVVEVPVRHMAVTGQTQESGKTTTLEALISRSGLRAIAFITKRAESSLMQGRLIAPYFRERADWQFVAAVLEATLRERLKFERSWIMRACKGARTLADVQRNIERALPKAKGLSADVYMTLNEYLKLVIPQVDRLPYKSTLDLASGLNVMDLASYSMELQALVIRSVLEWVYEHGEGVITIIPEAWEFLPQSRSSPVLLAAEQLIRKGGAARNFVWIDSQDIAGVHKNILRSVGVWILGVQREANEVKRMLAHIPPGVERPSIAAVMKLERGQFFACFGSRTVKVYAQPAWVEAATAKSVALGLHRLPSKPVFKPTLSEEEAAALRQGSVRRMPAVTEEEASALRKENHRLNEQVRKLQQEIDNLNAAGGRSVPALAAPDKPSECDEMASDYLFHAVKERLLKELPNDPKLLRLLTERPELRVEVTRRTITASGDTLFGRLAMLISEGFFDQPKTGNAAFNELNRRGIGSAKPNVYRETDKLAAYGFLTKESVGYQAFPGMKVNIVPLGEAV